MKCKGEDMCDCNGSCRSNAHAMHGNVEYLGTFPDWWDERGRMTLAGGVPVIAHPDHPVMKLNMETKQWEELKPC